MECSQSKVLLWEYICVFMNQTMHGYDFWMQVQHLFPSSWLWRTTCSTWGLSPTPALWWRGECCSELWGGCRKLSRALGKSTHEILFITLFKKKKDGDPFLLFKDAPPPERCSDSLCCSVSQWRSTQTSARSWRAWTEWLETIMSTPTGRSCQRAPETTPDWMWVSILHGFHQETLNVL